MYFIFLDMVTMLSIDIYNLGYLHNILQFPPGRSFHNKNCESLVHKRRILQNW